MPQQLTTAVENNFTKGLITEATGLNFPENAATECDNVEFTLIGHTLRRLGIDYEENFVLSSLDRTGKAVASYKWNNSGGDGSTQVIVLQVGTTLYFYLSSAATVAGPISAHRLGSIVNLDGFTATGGTFDATQECQFSDGNGYLFVFHPSCEPIYVTNSGGTMTATVINVFIRDFYGVIDNNGVSQRPTTLSIEHQYNLQNQGWTSGSPWSATSDFTPVSLGSVVFNVGTVTGITLGDQVTGWSWPQYYFPGGPLIYDSKYVTFGGTVTAYSAPNLTITINSGTNVPSPGSFQFSIFAVNKGYLNTWNTAEGNYPSNSDVWWYFKNASGVFDPATTQPNVSYSAGNAPTGHYIMSAFNMDRASAGSIPGLTPVRTSQRPTTGAWFQSRLWFTGLNDSQQQTGDAQFYTWSENIYFSQVSAGTGNNFGNCFQVNDPTSENLFDILPTDGGVISIPGSGTIYKLFPIQNGLLVFAQNGVWFITGSQGIGFSATDYTVTKISAVQSISATSFVDVLGLPFFWNEDGIYQVAPQQNGGLSVEPLTVSTIQTFFDNIPNNCKKYARGAYHPIDYTIQWVYAAEEGTTVTDRYTFDSALTYNTYNKAFYPHTFNSTNTSICSIQYFTGITAETDLSPGFKYFAGSLTDMTLADFHDETYTDWASSTPKNFVSYFITGYKLRGKAMYKFQPQYIMMYSGTDEGANGYDFQGIWDWSNDRNSGRWSSVQRVLQGLSKFNTIHRRLRIRGRGYSLQFKLSSIDNKPFNIAGWAAVDTVNAGA